MSDINFGELLEYFPPVELPLSLSGDAHLLFSRLNKPIPQEVVGRYFDLSDEYVEYVPCFRLKPAPSIVALVTWKASLLEYEYLLTTFTSAGKQCHARSIAGLKSNGETMLERVATIDSDHTIMVAEGLSKLDQRYYDAANSRTHTLIIDTEGQIIPAPWQD